MRQTAASQPTPNSSTSENEAGTYREYFETRKPAGFARPLVKLWHSRMFTRVSTYIAGLAEKRILEVGAGWGFFAEVCRSRGARYQGLEMNPGQARALRADGHDVVVGVIPPFPPGAPADVVWMSHVLEHAVDYRHALAMATAAHARVERGGYLVVIAPDLLSWREEFWNGDWSHGFPTTVRRVRELVTEAGFEVVAAEHHTASFRQDLAISGLTRLLALIPYEGIDQVLNRAIGHGYAYAFMTVFGWRQILVIGRKA